MHFRDQDGDGLMILSLGRDGVRHATFATALKPGSSFYCASLEQVSSICKRMYEAAALRWPPAIGLKREQAARMRQRKAALGATGGQPERLQDDTKAAAAAAWADLTKTARDVALEFNVGARTLYRLSGPKGMPRFGKKPKT
jgi:hypothetical protein